MDVLVNGISLKTYGVKTLSFNVSSPSPRAFTEQIDYRSGFLDLGATLEGRTIRASFYMQSFDKQDYELLKNEVFNLFDARKTFYLTDTRQKGKRWLVRTADVYNIERVAVHFGRFDVEFISPSSFAESVGTTLDPLTFDAELWQIGQGLESDDLVYVYETTSFSVFNAGDVTIDPRELPLKITFTGASTNLSITNDTTGDTWSYTGSSVDGDIVVLDGVKSTKNGTSIFGDTNRQLLTLEPGWNNFTITGASGSFEITFDFRFYYL